MKTCPYCKNEIQDNAEFCLYCMRPLTQKPNVTPTIRRSSKRSVIILIISALLLACAIITALCVLSSSDNKDETAKDTEDQAQNIVDAEEDDAEEDDAEEDEYSFNEAGRSKVFPNYEDFKVLAAVTTQKTGSAQYFNPYDFRWTHTVTDDDNDTWELYTADCGLENVVIRVAFCEGDLEVMTTICNLTEENYEQGMMIASACITAVYNSTFDELDAALRNDVVYPRREITYEESLFGDKFIPEPMPARVDKDTEMIINEGYLVMENETDETHYLFMEEREREYKGTTYYDLGFLHTFE